MTIIRINHGRIVQAVAGGVAAGPFTSNAEAWRAVDRLEREPISPAERRIDFAWSQFVRGL